MTTCRRFRHRPLPTVLAMLTLASGLPSAQDGSRLAEARPEITQASQASVQSAAASVAPQSRRRLTRDEFSALTGQTLQFSVRTRRWPFRVVKGTVVGVGADDVTIRTSKTIESFPIATTMVVSTLPGDFAALLGQRIEISVRRWPPRTVVGRVVSVDTAEVVIATDNEEQRFSVAKTLIMSRTPDRDRKREGLATLGIVVGVFSFYAIKCSRGHCE